MNEEEIIDAEIVNVKVPKKKKREQLQFHLENIQKIDLLQGLNKTTEKSVIIKQNPFIFANIPDYSENELNVINALYYLIQTSLLRDHDIISYKEFVDRTITFNLVSLAERAMISRGTKAEDTYTALRSLREKEIVIRNFKETDKSILQKEIIGSFISEIERNYEVDPHLVHIRFPEFVLRACLLDYNIKIGNYTPVVFIEAGLVRGKHAKRLFEIISRISKYTDNKLLGTIEGEATYSISELQELFNLEGKSLSVIANTIEYNKKKVECFVPFSYFTNKRLGTIRFKITQPSPEATEDF